MLRDVFYYGEKPNAHPREKFAVDLEDARQQATTEHFWIINEHCNYKDFDWDWDFAFLPDEDVWAEEHINVWPSQYQKDSGTWLCSTNPEALIVYRADVDPIQLKDEIKSCWKNIDWIDRIKFDFKWHPDPTDPPYIYVFGTQWQKTGGPIYEVPGATEIKYVDSQLAKRLQNFTNWEIPENVDKASFDFSWHPDDTEEPYIYEFATEWNNRGGPKYIVPGATQYKYITYIKCKLKPNKDNWIIPKDIIEQEFDWSWVPHPDDPPYIYQFGTQWQKTGGPRYVVPGATEIKYVDTLKAKVKCTQFANWKVPRNIDQTTFDFSWHPDPADPPYIYQFGDQWQKTGGPRFVMDGATEVKLVSSPIAIAKPDMTHWEIPEGLDTSNFDFSWHPNIEDKPKIYQFKTQWSKTNGPRFIAPGANGDSEVEYVDITCPTLPDKSNLKWKILIDIDDFDFSWHPDSTEDPYIYVFGNMHNDAATEPTIEYRMPGATEYKYVTDIVAKTKPQTERWNTLIPVVDFDYTWRPNPGSPPYIYVWGNQWNDCHKEPTVTYTVPGATEYKYMDEVATAASTENEEYWEILIPISQFDFSWRPDPTEPPFIYVFGNKYNDAETEPTVIYRVPGATEYKFIDDLLATPKVNMTNWSVRNEIDLKVFDFSWRPNPNYKPARYEWGHDGPIYTIPDYEDIIKFDYDTSIRSRGVVENKLEDLDIKKLIVRSMFFVDRGNQQSQERFTELKKKFPQLQKTRYLNSWVDTISRCVAKSETELFWVLSSELDYSDFVFDYNPNPWQKKMIHVFGSQWTHWGNTYLVNKETFNEDTKYVKVIEHLSMLNFVKDKRAKATNCLYDVVLIDHGNEYGNVVNMIKSKILDKDLKIVKYKNSYLRTFKEMLTQLESKKEHYIWVCSSVCDYENFDFSYICDPFAKEQLHVFPSDKQKFGDTFLVDVNKFRSLVDDMIMLEDYEKVNYNQHQRAKRLLPPTIVTQDDTLTQAIHTDFDFPYAVFKTVDNKDLDVLDTEPMSLWTPDSKNIIITSAGATRAIVPKEAKDYVEEELYDYPYISRSKSLAKSKPLDIVFLSNGEKGADENYEHLLKVTKGLRNRVVRVDGVNGRVQAYHAAASASETPWMFTVFAKLEVDKNFDWDWQPDRLQIPKHYIFNATNPVNNLVYGHQAMIAYNKKITLANVGRGLDFTLDDAHEVVEMNSGIAKYNTDEWTTWRTAFREALKLKATIVNNPDDNVSTERLLAWSTIGNGQYGQFSVDGALDAIEYYDSVNGDMDKLRLSYDWPWLRAYFESKYK